MKINKIARIILFFLKISNLRTKKEKISRYQGIRPCKTNTIYPNNWKNPIEKKLSTGEIITFNPIENWINTHYALKDLGIELSGRKLDRVPYSDAIDNSH